MRRLKAPLTVLLVLFVLIDAVVGFRLFSSGWPKRVTLSDIQTGSAKVQVASIPFTAFDWLILALAIGVHIVLFYLVWKTWRSDRLRV